jgi:hypothetical protein
MARASRGRRAIDPVAFVLAALATLVAFVAVNVIVWPYHYEPAMTLALAALALACVPSPPHVEEAIERRTEALVKQ